MDFAAIVTNIGEIDLETFTVHCWAVEVKMKTRSKQGQGGQYQMTNKSSVSSNWCNFLRHNDNKADLFHFLADKIAHMTLPNMAVVTKGPDVLNTSETSLDSLNICFHEEANNRIFVCARFATEEGSKAIMIKSTDTDVFLIALSNFPSLQGLGLQQLWVAFGHS